MEFSMEGMGSVGNDVQIGSDPLLNISVNSYASPVFEDVDNDNDLDLVIGSGDGKLYYFENQGLERSLNLESRAKACWQIFVRICK